MSCSVSLCITGGVCYSVSMTLRELEQSHADLSKIPPLEPNRLVGFINHFAVSMVQQLSNLNDAADQRLYRLHSRLLTCKTNLLILEKKLDSVDGLSAAPTADPVPVASASQSDRVPEMSGGVHSDGDEEGDAEAAEEPADVQSDETDRTETTGDEELQRFYKMLKVGVPLPAVRIKMASEGVDPDLLKV